MLPPRGPRAPGSATPGVRRKPPGEMDALVRAALDCARPGLIVLDRERRVRLVTRNAAEMLGVRAVSRGPQMSVMRLLAASPMLDHAALQTLVSAFNTSDTANREVLLSVGGPQNARVIALDIRPARNLGWVASLEDVTQTRQTQDWLLEHVSSDAMTGLWNRQHFMLMLRDRLEMRDAGNIAVILVNLRRFRAVNETHGTDAGDALLRLVGGRLGGLLREEDMLARFAGDEFAIMVSGLPGQEGVKAMGARIMDLAAKPYVIEGQVVTIGVNLGIACAPEDGTTPEALVANASLALASASSQPNAQAAGGGLSFFEPRLDEQARHRRTLELDLYQALEHGEFVLHYQPQVDVHRGCVVGFEALVRWASPTRGLVPPVTFIPVAEQIGLIGSIGEWVLNEACHEAMKWPNDVNVAVNASPLQFETGDYAAAVLRALKSSGLPAHRLEVEVTENLLLRDNGTVTGSLDSLRALGVRLVLDDFGTGYASLSQLSRFKFDKIKIDRSFISAPDAAAQHSAIVRSIAALGVSLGIPTTAEGVETVGQLDQIRKDGCSCVQGYYFSRPVPRDQVAGLIASLHHPDGTGVPPSIPDKGSSQDYAMSGPQPDNLRATDAELGA